MQVTSSKKPMGNHDRSFGSRAVQNKKPKVSFGHVVGEREITFAPEKKGKAQKATRGEDKHSDGKRDKGRRSASGNVFRNL